MSEKKKIIEVDVRSDFRIFSKLNPMNDDMASRIYEKNKNNHINTSLIRKDHRGVSYSELPVDGLRFLIFNSRATTLQQKAIAIATVIIRSKSTEEFDLFSTNAEIRNDLDLDLKEFIPLLIEDFKIEHSEKLIELGLIEPTADADEEPTDEDDDSIPEHELQTCYGCNKPNYACDCTLD